MARLEGTFEGTHEPTRVLVIAADPLVRAGLASLLAAQGDILVVGQWGAQPGLAAEVKRTAAQVALWDMGLDGDSSEALAASGEIGAPVVALVSVPTEAGRVWAAGVQGLLLRDATGAAIAAALHAAHMGHVVLAPEVARSLTPRAPDAGERPAEELTPREREVLQLLAEGIANKEIAHRLGVSDHTVKFHVNAILSKLGAQSRTDAVVRATRLGLVLL